MSVIVSFLSDCARRRRWSRGLIALQSMSVELETNTLIQEAALKYAFNAAIPHPEISLSLLYPTYIFSHTKLVCELVETLSRNKRVHFNTNEELSSSTNLLISEHLEEKYCNFLLESMQLCRAKYCQESHKQKLKSDEAAADENLELWPGNITMRERKRNEVLRKDSCEECSTSITTSSLSSATRTLPQMKCTSSSEYISTHETEVQNALFISCTHWCDWSMAQRLYNQLICPSEASKEQFELLYKFALETWHECGSFSSYIQWFYAIEQKKLHKHNKEHFQEEMLSLNTAHKNCFHKTCTSSDELVSSECLTREFVETQQKTGVIINGNTSSGRDTTAKRKSRASLELECLRREEEIKQKYIYLCELITLGLSNSPSVISCAFLLRCATRPIISTNSTQNLLINNVCHSKEGNAIITNLPTITLRMALSSVESHYMTNELMLWYLRCIGLCAPWLAQVALEAVQFDERVRRTKGNSCNCDALQSNSSTTDNDNCDGKTKHGKMFSDVDKCSQEHNTHVVNSYNNSLSMMLIKLWLLSRNNWQVASLYLNELHEVVNNATKRPTQTSFTDKTERVDQFVIRYDHYNNSINHGVDLDVKNNVTNSNVETSSSKQNDDNSGSSCDQTTEKAELREEWCMEEQELFWECTEDTMTRTAMPRSVFFTHFPHKGQPSVKLIVPTRRGVAHALAHGWRIEKIQLSRLYKHWSTNSHWREMLYLYRRIPTPEFQKRLVHVLLRLRPCIAELDDTFQRELAASCEENNNIITTIENYYDNNNNNKSHDNSVESVITAEHIITLICGTKNNILAPCAGSIIALIASCAPSDWVRALQLFRRCVRAGGACTPATLSTIMNTNIPSQELETLLTNYSSAVNNGIRRRALEQFHLNVEA